MSTQPLRAAWIAVWTVASLAVAAAAWAEPTPEMLRQTIRDYISAQQASQVAFKVFDSRIGQERTLTLERVHERVGKTGDYYYSCADLKDVQSGDVLDLDFDVSDAGGALKVVDIRIHKDNGTPRYTYDANDNIIPVPAA
ncbi:MAG: hypothetical protein HY714_01610 [Candidatus Omnitrophica bacterium]|nr:hypothetical protein [Candidatus Omnitrophota bacterium]